MAGATFVPEVDIVHKVECVEWVGGLDMIFPEWYLPSKTNNYEEGGRTYIAPSPGRYTGAYIPDADCQLKRISFSFTAYNIEDTVDILVGEQYLVRNSPVIEMADKKDLELYKDVPAGTPIIINFNNHSGTEKTMFYSVYTVTNDVITENLLTLRWNFYWSGYDTILPEGSTFTYTVDAPNYVNSQNIIKDVEVVVGSLQQHMNISTIRWNPVTGTTSSYIESDPFYQGFRPLARDKSIVLTDMNVADRKITFVFTNVVTTATGVNDFRIGMDLKGLVLSEYY